MNATFDGVFGGFLVLGQGFMEFLNRYLIPGICLIFFGIIQLCLAFYLRHYILKKYSALPASCRTSLWGEFWADLVLMAAGNFFARYCLRGWHALTIAGCVFAILPAIGSHLRATKAIRETADVEDAMKKLLVGVHKFFAGGMLLLSIGIVATYLMLLWKYELI